MNDRHGIDETASGGLQGSSFVVVGFWRTRIRPTAAALLALMVASGCIAPTVPAPVQSGVCWRMEVQPRGRPVFMPVAADAPDLLSCAADLELAYLSEGAPVTGAYQGRFIFIDALAIKSAERLDLLRYPVFGAALRASLDRQLRAVLAAQVKSAGARRKD